MVAYLQDGVADDDRLVAKSSEKPKPTGLPLTHEAALKWFYKDPQGEIQGKTGRGSKFDGLRTNAWFLSFDFFWKTTPSGSHLRCLCAQVHSVTRR